MKTDPEKEYNLFSDENHRIDSANPLVESKINQTTYIMVKNISFGRN